VYTCLSPPFVLTTGVQRKLRMDLLITSHFPLSVQFLDLQPSYDTGPTVSLKEVHFALPSFSSTLAETHFGLQTNVTPQRLLLEPDTPQTFTFYFRSADSAPGSEEIRLRNLTVTLRLHPMLTFVWKVTPSSPSLFGH
jgi:hypothetical protein